MSQSPMLPSTAREIALAASSEGSLAPWRAAVSVSTIVACGVVAGLLFAFSVSVMPALAKVSDANGASVMQQINVVILNPVFGLFFGGSIVLCLVSGVFAFRDLSRPGAMLMLVGCAVFLVGTIGVTMALNVPMNGALAAKDAASAAGRDYWQDYLTRWTLLNHVRTFAGVVAIALQAFSLTR